MNISNLEAYFKKYIINYLPFEDQILYTSIVNFLLTKYSKDTYTEIPTIFKSVFEKQSIPVELYDIILLSNGFPHDLISNLSFYDKYTLLYSFMDYTRYKGTLSQIKKVCNSFYDTLNVYELFIEKQEKYGWVFVPYPVYLNNNIKQYKNLNPILFNDLAPKLKHFFITEEQLDLIYDSDDDISIVPIKTNLIYIDYKNITEYNEINKIIFSIVFHYFKSYTVALYFEKGAYQTSFENAYKLWYYILLKVYYLYPYPNLEYYKHGEYVYNESTHSMLFQRPIFPIIYNIHNKNFPFKSLDNIPKLIEDYNKIGQAKNLVNQSSDGIYVSYDSNGKKLFSFDSKREDLTNFYNKWIKPFEEEDDNDEVDLEILLQKYKSLLPSDLMEYIDSFLSVTDRIILERNAVLLLSAIRNSLITWSYSFSSDFISKYNRYLLTFMDQLTTIKVNFNQTTTYAMLMFLKPLHAELVYIEDFLVLVKNKFNSVYMDHNRDTLFDIIVPLAIQCNISDYMFQEITLVTNDNLKIIQNQLQTIVYRKRKKYFIKDTNLTIVNSNINILTQISDYSSNINTCFSNDRLNSSEQFNLSFKKYQLLPITVTDSRILINNLEKYSSFNLSNYSYSNINYLFSDKLGLKNAFNHTLTKTTDDNISLLNKLNYRFKFINGIDISISDSTIVNLQVKYLSVCNFKYLMQSIINYSLENNSYISDSHFQKLNFNMGLSIKVSENYTFIQTIPSIEDTSIDYNETFQVITNQSYNYNINSVGISYGKFINRDTHNISDYYTGNISNSNFDNFALNHRFNLIYIPPP